MPGCGTEKSNTLITLLLCLYVSPSTDIRATVRKVTLKKKSLPILPFLHISNIFVHVSVTSLKPLTGEVNDNDCLIKMLNSAGTL